MVLPRPQTGAGKFPYHLELRRFHTAFCPDAAAGIEWIAAGFTGNIADDQYNDDMDIPPSV